MNDTTDWYDLRPVANDSVRIAEAGGYYMYAIADRGETLLIDTGIGVGDLSNALGRAGYENVRVLLTHSHWDHIGGAHWFDDVLANPAEIGPGSVITAADWFADRPLEVIDELRAEGIEFPEEFEPETYAIHPVVDVGPVDAGDELDVGSRTLELVGIPGHSPGQLAVLDREGSRLYAADLIGGDGKLLAHFPDSELEDYRDTFERLIELRDRGAYDTLLTAHNPPIEGDELSLLEKVLGSLKRILEGDATYTLETLSTGRARLYEFDDFRVFARPNR